MRDLSEVPDGWREVELGNAASIRKQQTQPVKGDARPYVALEHIASGGSLNGYGKAGESISNKTTFLKGDTLYGKLRPNLRKVVRAGFDGVCSTDILAVFAHDRVDGDFLSQLMRSDHLYSHAMRGISGTKMPRTSWRHLEKFRLPLPPMPEQRAIAAVLDAIDEAIERTTAVISATERLRDALLHELLTRGVPDWHTEWRTVPGLGLIPADWRIRRLSEVAEVKGGKRLPKGASFADEDTGLPYIRIVDFRDRTVDSYQIKYLRPETHKVIRRYTIRSSDIYISIAGTIGLVGIVPCVLDGANLTENAAKITIFNYQLLSQHVLLAFLVSRAGQAQIYRRINALGQPKLALQRINTISIPLPSICEQRTISTTLASVGDGIDQLREEDASLQSLKAAATDMLLTGRVRMANKIDHA